MKKPPKISVLTGGVGGSKFLMGLRDELISRYGLNSLSGVTVIANTGDDIWLNGIRLQPDIDSVIYGLAGVKDLERGWGRIDESERVSSELRAYGAGWPWFTLGDLDIGTHLARTGWLREGISLNEIVKRLVSRWGVGFTILPMTESEVDTQVLFSGEGGEESMHFQEWWTRYRADIPPRAFINPGIESSLPAAGVIEAISSADIVIMAPSNPIVSIGPILAVPGIRDAIASTHASVVGISPIIGGKVVRGMADICLETVGVEVSARGVASHYGARSSGGLVDALLIDSVDESISSHIRDSGIRVLSRSIWMRDDSEASSLAGATLDFAQD